MRGARGVAEVYRAQWAAHLNSAVANALRQTLAEKPPDPVAGIGRYHFRQSQTLNRSK